MTTIAKLIEMRDAASPAPWSRQDPDGSPTSGIGYRILAGSFEKCAVNVESRDDAEYIVQIVEACKRGGLLERHAMLEELWAALNDPDDARMPRAIAALRASEALPPGKGDTP